MADVLGWRCKFGVVTPSTNTVVQPEYDEMRPRGRDEPRRAHAHPERPDRAATPISTS